jgi:hypothetical protein
MKPLIPFLLSILVISACSGEAPPAQPDIDLEPLAREYLFLELSMGAHDEGHVDAYFGPEEIRQAAQRARLSLTEIRLQAADVTADLQTAAAQTSDPTTRMRIDGLLGRLTALETRVDLNEDKTLPFDQESERLFAARAPDHDAAYFQAILDDIDELLGGEGDLPTRVTEFQSQFIIPTGNLRAVFAVAIEECRRRTLEHIELPENESFSIEYVTEKPWSGYNWYQGDAQSLIQINTDLPIYISRAVDLGCHEGYPGHHTYNALLEKNLVNDRGWLEFSLYPLFSPQSLVAEGSGNYGIDLAFPGEERIRFEKEELFPLAGLDASEADRYYELQELLARLEYAGNEAARDYLDGSINREQAIQWLVDYALTSPERATQRTEFFDTYRSYVINYNLGKDIVREYIEQGNADTASRWQRFEGLLSSPMTAVELTR